ncbi:MAG: sulfatase-like hydrolase/transferase [Acidobacteriota bacterium]
MTPERRYARLWWLATLALGCLTTGCGNGWWIEGETGAGEDGLAPASPSFLLVTLDTTRADRLEPYGGDVATPTLQALASEGIVFEHAYAATPVTLPSHATIFTGLDPPAHGVRNNGIHALSASMTTLAEVLTQEGYHSAAFVSAAVLERRYGLDQGFATYDDDLAAGRPKAPRVIAERPAEVTIDAARAWLDQAESQQPLFLWVHLFDPHAVYAPPEPFASQYSDRPYEGEIAYVDAQLGRLLDHPRLDDNLLVFVIADHGESLGEHGENSHGMLAYDATLRIPWIVRLPGGGAPIRLRHEVGQVDVMPTALELLGLDQALDANSAIELNGTSQAPAIVTSGARGVDPRMLYAETLVPYYTYGWARLHSVRRAGWKWIDAPAPEFFHLPADPGELQNLLETQGERGRELRDELRRRASEEGPASELKVDAVTRAKLRSLGYLTGRAGEREQRPDPKVMIGVHLALERAQEALYRHDFERALIELRAVLQKDPENLAGLSDLAKALAEQGELEEALRLAKRAVELDPENAGLHLGLSVLSSRSGDESTALEAIEASLALDPRSIDAGLEKVRVLYRLERHDEAIELLRAMALEYPSQPRIDIGVAELIEAPAGRTGEAEARLRRAVEREPYLKQGWLALGSLLAVQQPADAVAVYRQALTFQPRDMTLRARLGVLLAQSGEPEAEEHLQAAAVALRPPSVEVHGALAVLALEHGRWAAAEQQARRAIELVPEHAESWNHLAIALEEQQRPSAAIEAYRRALASDPGHWRSGFNLGLLLKRQGRLEAAAEAFRDVLEQQPSHAKSHYELGVLYGGSLGDTDRASEHLRIALELEPGHSRAERVRRMLQQLQAG